MNEQELAQVAQRLFESEHFYFKEFERFLEGSVWDEIRSSVPEDEQQRLELESITLEVAWDMTILTYLNDSQGIPSLSPSKRCGSRSGPPAAMKKSFASFHVLKSPQSLSGPLGS